MKKPGMTVEEHREHGRRLAEMRDELVHLTTLYGGRYPLKIMKQLDKAVRAIDQFRSDLDDIACLEHAKTIGDECIKLYYPPQEARGGND